jgi:hypothetical protein
MPDWLTERQATQYLIDKGLPIKKRYLKDQRARGKGPPCKYFGVHALFAPPELDRWIIEVALTDTTWSRRPSGKPRAKDKRRANEKQEARAD